MDSALDEEADFRALEGTYGQLKEELYAQPRVYRTRDMKSKGGPQNFDKKVINPQANRIAQSIEALRSYERLR